MVESIQISKEPTKTQYLEGEKFSTAGMQVVAYYSNGEESIVDNSQLEIIGGDKISSGDGKVIVSFGEYKTAEVAVYGTRAVYNVVFKNWDGSIISSETYTNGQTVKIPKDPTRQSNDGKKYIFVGWDNKVETICNGSAEYMAVFEEVKYLVTFRNWDGSIISSESYSGGQTVIVPKSPTRVASGGKQYEFIGWDKQVETICNGNAEYMAMFGEIVDGQVKCLVMFKNWDGSIIMSGYYSIGDAIVLPQNPTREATDENEYKFIGWDKPISSTCNGETVYTAKFQAIKKGDGSDSSLMGPTGRIIVLLVGVAMLASAIIIGVKRKKRK